MSSTREIGCLERLQAVILMDGSVRPNPFALAVGRSLLNLPVDSERDLLDFWQSEAEGLAREIGFDRLPVRVVIDQSAPLPTAPEPIERVFFDVQRDPVEFRGSGGLLRDIAKDYADDDYLLFCGGSQLLNEPLAAITLRLAEARGDVMIAAHRGGTPGGPILVRCGCLHPLAAIGFVDFKEQGLPMISVQHDVRVVQWERPSVLPIRSATSYIHALRQFHQTPAQKERRDTDTAFEEDWRPTFAIIEEGAMVDPTAELLDSVALAGSRIEEGAYAVRSVLCAGSRVHARQTILASLHTRESR